MLRVGAKVSGGRGSKANIVAVSFSKILKSFNRQFCLRLDYGARLYASNISGQLPGFTIRHWIYRNVTQMKLGSGSSVHRGTHFFCLGGITIGEGTVINGECWLDGRKGLTIGANVSISAGSRLLTLGHDPYSAEFSPLGGEIVVEDYAWLGAFCLVLPGVRIGRGAVVGAGSVVTKDVAPLAIVAGNPARVIGTRPPDLHYSLDQSPLFF